MNDDAARKGGLYSPENEHDSCGIGFVASIKGHPSHEIVSRGLEVLLNMTHRGAESSDNVTGDGAGITVQIPHTFFLTEVPGLPSQGEYGAGIMFLPHDVQERETCEKIFAELLTQEGLSLIHVRDVPVNHGVLGEIAKSNEPYMKQVFITGQFEQDDLERKLYVVRKLAEKQVRESGLTEKAYFYFPSLSTRIMIYKGMFTPEQLMGYYADLQDKRFESAIAVVHSRFSTNTFPTWDLAQPFRFIAHNGEINTIKANRLWIKTR